MNIFFLGAGFSRPAGLPLGDGLWLEVVEVAKSMGCYEGHLEDAIQEYLNYYYGTTGKRISEAEIKLEKFMSYLDIDRQLKLKGGEYTAPEETFKNLIAYVIHSHERRVTNPRLTLYEQFAERLGPNDIIFTFNYDTILENTLRRKNISYRLYEFRYRHDERAHDLVIDAKREVVIYKMHGSINWFDKSHYQEWKDYWLQMNYDKNPPYAVFDGRMNGEVHKLLDEPFQPSDPLRNIYIVENLDKYFDIYFKRQYSSVHDTPFIIAPSYQKLISLNFLSDFWGGFANSIIAANRIAIIGFSLPEHDEYIRQPMYWYIKNFHHFGEPISGQKSKLIIIDHKKNLIEIDEFKANYKFVDEKTTDFYFGGFCEEALDIIFSKE